jgi:hypothetical protein
MAAERRAGIESLEDLQRRHSDELREEEGDAALDRLIEEIADRWSPESGPEPYEPMESEFACRGCRLIFSRSCLADRARTLCRDCTALAAVGELRPRDVPPVLRIHHPCPACGALVTVPEREEVPCGFVCPSCRVHLMKSGGHVHLVWNHPEAVIERVEP